MQRFFFYGTLCHAPLLQVVLGHLPPTRPAALPDHAVYWTEGECFPMIRREPGATAEGLLVEGVGPSEAERLDFYEGGFGYETQVVRVLGGPEGVEPAEARIYFPDPSRWRPAAPWRLEDWVARWGEIAVEAAQEFMRAHGRYQNEQVLARYPALLGRAASRLRAQSGGETTLRRTASPGDVEIRSAREPYAGFFSVEEADLRFRRFDGTMSDEVERSAFVTGDVVTVLPYDARRDRVMVVEQFRFGPQVRGDSQPWQIETIAGRVDAGETPEAAARREAKEETGLELDGLVQIARYYSSPGGLTEFIYAYLALVDLPDGLEGVGGAESESEDIRAHLISFDRLMELCATGEASAGPLVLSAYWLARERERLRREAGAEA